MRGIEGALRALEEVEKGAFASEALRKVWEDVDPTERKLAATLVYLVERRLGLWRHLLARYCRRPVESLHPETVSALIVGIAGVLELKHFKPGVLVNALVQRVKRIRAAEAARESSLTNAVLRAVMEKAPSYVEELKASPALRDQALAYGVPGWAASQWSRDFGTKDAKRILRLVTSQTYLAVRLSPDVSRANWIREFKEPSVVSDVSDYAVRLESNPYPPELPGYAEGAVTPQSESSIWAVEEVISHLNGETLLDMCMGRGIKAGQLLTFCKDLRITGWDMSRSRLSAAQREFSRLGVAGRVTTLAGDSAVLEPDVPPENIFLDAPCSGSGTWGRHPEGKWRMTPEKLTAASKLQRSLFARAADILAPEGILAYCTCSLFREENENVVGSVLASRRDLVELPLHVKNPASRRGKPYGTLVMPESPWMDGFYIAIFKKKG